MRHCRYSQGDLGEYRFYIINGHKFKLCDVNLVSHSVIARSMNETREAYFCPSCWHMHHEEIQDMIRALVSHGEKEGFHVFVDGRHVIRQGKNGKR